ncbi:MAG TPA: hypothetical protein PKN95_10630, partial [Verrucomicrobiota bacterium]|nr:hypothetical protein [Verrucomicrobiota bacterium]HNT15700.1 hypothetical protein [Verrucomicrobiota bacterium]
LPFVTKAICPPAGNWQAACKVARLAPSLTVANAASSNLPLAIQRCVLSSRPAIEPASQIPYIVGAGQHSSSLARSRTAA